LSPIIIVPKKNGKLRICIYFRKLNASTKKDPYPLPFTDEVLNTIVRYETLFLRWIFRISSNPYSSRGQIQNYICYKFGGFYIEGDVI